MKLLLVEWLDSNRHDGWTSIESLGDLEDGLACCSIGWLLSESKSSVTLLAHLSLTKHGEPRAAMGSLAIPKRAIVKRKDLTGALEEGTK